MGSFCILHAQHGDDKLQLPKEGAEAKKKVEDLINKRYTLTLTYKTGEGDSAKEETTKVTSFDADKYEFVCKGTGAETRHKPDDVTVVAVAPTCGG